MTYLIAAAFLVWVVLLVASLEAWLEYGGWKFPIVAFALAVAGIGFAIEKIDEKNRKNPCVEYEQQMRYNPATKTIMPLRVCVERGEWVE